MKNKKIGISLLHRLEKKGSKVYREEFVGANSRQLHVASDREELMEGMQQPESANIVCK